MEEDVGMTLTTAEIAMIVASLGPIALVLTDDELQLICHETLEDRPPTPKAVDRTSATARHTAC